jgi:uncharacterized protein YggE
MKSFASAVCLVLPVAAGAGRSFNRILRIEEQGVSSPPPVPYCAALAEQRFGEPPTVAGQIEVRAHVTVTSLLK